MYVNTPGTSTPDGRAIGFETEAFAISDCMNYIKPPVYTIGVGQVREGCRRGKAVGSSPEHDGRRGGRCGSGLRVPFFRWRDSGCLGDHAVCARQANLLSPHELVGLGRGCEPSNIGFRMENKAVSSRVQQHRQYCSTTSTTSSSRAAAGSFVPCAACSLGGSIGC